MCDLLGDSESEGVEGDIKFRVNKEYAARYNNWREKEVLQKLKDKYGENALKELSSDESNSSEEEDENAKELTADIEKNFFKALSCLKKKDPRIYNESVKFFEHSPTEKSPGKLPTKKCDLKSAKKEEKKPFLLRDYDRKILIEKGADFNEDDDEHYDEKYKCAASPTFAEEQRALKDSFKHVLSNENDDSEEVWGGLFKKRTRTKDEIEKEEEDYREWLKGQKEKLPDKTTEDDLKHLHDYWNDPSLNPDEAFLRDYILNKKDATEEGRHKGAKTCIVLNVCDSSLSKKKDRFLDSEDEDYIPTYNEIVHDSDEFSNEEKEIERQEEFEHKYNFRFEEPDKEFIKRYPRTMENSLRRKDDRRKRKRQEIKERKEAEKTAKREEMKQLRALKSKEIIAKIEKIKEITGNQDIGFKAEDLDDDFDPEEHDRRMRKLFNKDYYGEVEEEKPEFPELDKELEIENWEEWHGNDQSNSYADDPEYGPHCEDPDFNMDCDYDPRAALQEELIQSTKGKRKRKRQSKFAQMLSKAKPLFNPNDKKFEEYVDEYYKFDFEDIIGDMPCRFKWRKTVPNNFGLTTDEILRADVKELNRWCSLKKILQHKPEHVEVYDVKAYKRKARDENLKKKILPSLYTEQVCQDEENRTDTLQNLHETKKGKKSKNTHNMSEGNWESPVHCDVKEGNVFQDKINVANGRQEKAGRSSSSGMVEIQEKKRKHTDGKKDGYKESKKKHKLMQNNDDPTRNMDNGADATEPMTSKKKKRKALGQDMAQTTVNGANIIPSVVNANSTLPRKKKKNHSTKNESSSLGISDGRLKAYGLKPKKFKNKLKYGEKHF